MTTFKCAAKGPGGKTVEGTIEAADRQEAVNELRKQKLVVMRVDVLAGGKKAKVKKAMWSRRAQEYEQKINSGDLIAIAEVVRDLHRADDQREQSYSERQLYEAALERLIREIAAVSGNDEAAAAREIDGVLVGRAAAA